MAQTLDITNYDAGRQDVLFAKATLKTGTGYDTVTQETLKAIAVPAGAIVLGGYVYVSDATTASADLDVGDGDDTDRYSPTPVNIDATGLTALTATGYKYTTDDTIDFTTLAANPAADGVIEVGIWYIIEGRAAFVQK